MKDLFKTPNLRIFYFWSSLVQQGKMCSATVGKYAYVSRLPNWETQFQPKMHFYFVSDQMWTIATKSTIKAIYWFKLDSST